MNSCVMMRLIEGWKKPTKWNRFCQAASIFSKFSFSLLLLEMSDIRMLTLTNSQLNTVKSIIHMPMTLEKRKQHNHLCTCTDGRVSSGKKQERAPFPAWISGTTLQFFVIQQSPPSFQNKLPTILLLFNERHYVEHSCHLSGPHLKKGDFSQLLRKKQGNRG